MSIHDGKHDVIQETMLTFSHKACRKMAHRTCIIVWISNKDRGKMYSGRAAHWTAIQDTWATTKSFCTVSCLLLSSILAFDTTISYPALISCSTPLDVSVTSFGTVSLRVTP